MVQHSFFFDCKAVSKVFNGLYTITNPNSGEHRTFKVKTQNKDSDFAPGQRIISLMNGRDNENDYMSLGFIDDNGIRLFRKQKGKELSPDAMEYRNKLAKMFWSLATLGDQSPYHTKYGIRIEASKTCIICNRTLTNPESLRTGVGPECGKRYSIMGIEHG